MTSKFSSDMVRHGPSLASQSDCHARRLFLAHVASGIGLLLGILPGCRPQSPEDTSSDAGSNPPDPQTPDGVRPEAEPTTSPSQASKESRKETTQSVETRLTSMIAEQLGLEIRDVSRRKRLKEDLGMDSLDCVELVMEAEEEFDINIPDADAERLRTVGDVLDFVAANVD